MLLHVNNLISGMFNLTSASCAFIKKFTFLAINQDIVLKNEVKDHEIS